MIFKKSKVAPDFNIDGYFSGDMKPIDSQTVTKNVRREAVAIRSQ